MGVGEIGNQRQVLVLQASPTIRVGNRGGFSRTRSRVCRPLAPSGMGAREPQVYILRFFSYTRALQV